MSAWAQAVLRHPDNEMRMRALPELMATLPRQVRRFYAKDRSRYLTQAAALVLANELARDRRGQSHEVLAGRRRARS